MTPTLIAHPDAKYCPSCGSYYVTNQCHCWTLIDEPHKVTYENRHQPVIYGVCRVCKRDMSVAHDSVVKTKFGKYVHSHCYARRG